MVATRALLETTSSFRSFTVWRNALIGDERAAAESAFQCRKMVSTMALHEKLVTQKIIKEGAVFRLSADKSAKYQVTMPRHHNAGHARPALRPTRSLRTAPNDNAI